METNAIYAIEFPEKTLLFTESVSGILDYESTVQTQESRLKVEELLSCEPESLELVFPDEWKRPLYQRIENLKGRVYRYGKKDGLPLQDSSFGFLARFPELYGLILNGDYVSAGRLLNFSKKLEGFKSLIRHIPGDELFFAFLSYFLNDFAEDKKTTLASLLSGNASPGTAYRKVFDFARPFIEARTLEEFTNEAKRKVEHLLFAEKKHIVLPIVGSNYRYIVGEISQTLISARKSSERKSIVEGLSAKEIESRIRSYVDDFSIYLTPEPYNPHDENAIAVVIRDWKGHTSHAGYLKQEVAYLFVRLSSHPANLQSRIFRVTERGADIEVWA